MADERALAERLITYDTSRRDEIRSLGGFVKGWLEARDVRVSERMFGDLPVLTGEVGPTEDPATPHILLHGHLDVVPGRPEQFAPRVEGDRLIGRGAYDMKGGLAAMLCALADLADADTGPAARVTLVCVPDEESEEVDERSIDELVANGLRADFAITGEPTDLHIGVQAKGVLAMRVEVDGRSAHGSTPWLGDNAVLKGIDVFRRIESMPFTRESSEMFDRPSINLGRIHGGDAVNKVPDLCEMAVDVRFLPGQDPGEILAQVRAMPDVRVTPMFTRPPAIVSPRNPYVRALREAAKRNAGRETMSVGRDGASDAIAFLEAGVPAVEFGPRGGGHHGPDEWVSVASLGQYRRSLVDFVRALPAWLARDEGEGTGPGLRAIEGGRA